QADRLRVDQLCVVAAPLETVDEIVREPDAHPIGAIGPIENQYSRHCAARNSRKTGPIVTPDASQGQAAGRPARRDGQACGCVKMALSQPCHCEPPSRDDGWMD